MAEGLASISNTSIMDQKPKSVSDYHRQIRPPSSQGVGAERKRQGLLKGSQTQTDLWAWPTEEGLQPQDLTLLTDPSAINFPATLSAVYGWGLHTQRFLETLTSLKGKEGRGERPRSPVSPQKGRPPHGEHSCGKMKKTLLFKE